MSGLRTTGRFRGAGWRGTGVQERPLERLAGPIVCLRVGNGALGD
jgi:hypothetical protein